MSVQVEVQGVDEWPPAELPGWVVVGGSCGIVRLGAAGTIAHPAVIKTIGLSQIAVVTTQQEDPLTVRFVRDRVALNRYGLVYRGFGGDRLWSLHPADSAEYREVQSQVDLRARIAEVEHAVGRLRDVSPRTGRDLFAVRERALALADAALVAAENWRPRP